MHSLRGLGSPEIRQESLVMGNGMIGPANRLCEAAKQIEIAAEVLADSNESHAELFKQADEIRTLANKLEQTDR